MELVVQPSGLPAGVSAQELVDALPDGLVVVDRNGLILAVNDPLLELLGHCRSALLGRPVEVLVPGGVQDLHRSHREGFSSAPRTRGMGAGLDLHAATASGELIPVDVMLGPLPSAGPGCVLAAVRDVRERRSRELQWEHRALHDPLTGMANRSLVLDRLEQAALRAQRADTSVGVFFLDLEGFKRINDEHGHAVGDEVLVVVAQRLLAETRPSDTVGRMGGDEFIVVVEQPRGTEDSRFYVERLRAAVCAPMSVAGDRISLGCSIGSIFGDGRDGRSWLLEQADAAMFEDKAARRAVRG